MNCELCGLDWRCRGDAPRCEKCDELADAHDANERLHEDNHETED